MSADRPLFARLRRKAESAPRVDFKEGEILDVTVDHKQGGVPATNWNDLVTKFTYVSRYKRAYAEEILNRYKNQFDRKYTTTMPAGAYNHFFEVTRAPRGEQADYILEPRGLTWPSIDDVASEYQVDRVLLHSRTEITFSPVGEAKDKFAIDFDAVAGRLGSVLDKKLGRKRISGEKIADDLIVANNKLGHWGTPRTVVGEIDGFRVELSLERVNNWEIGKPYATSSLWSRDGSIVKGPLKKYHEDAQKPKLVLRIVDSRGDMYWDRPVIDPSKQEAMKKAARRIATAFGGPTV